MNHPRKVFMAKKKKPTLSRAILSLMVGIPALLSLTGRIKSLIGFEARLAGRSLVGIMILTIVYALLLSSSWLCVLAMLFVYLTSLLWSIQIILLTLLGINLIMLIIVGCIIRNYKKRLIFPETRHLLHDACKIYEDL